MTEIQHWDVYVCECTHHRSGLWNVAPKDMLCPHCNTEVRPLRVAPLPRETLTPVDPDSATILIGEGLHTGLRKGCEDGHDAWEAIHDLPEDQWSAALHFLVSGLDDVGYVLCERKSEESE